MPAQPVSVVIPVLNGAATIGRQIEALAHQRAAPSFDVVLVDNGCTDDTVAVARAAAEGKLRLQVVQEAAPGVNRARNAGVRAAADGIVLLCDADDEVAPAWVASLCAGVDEAHWAAGAVDYRSLNDDATVATWGCADSAVPSVTTPYVDRTFGGSCAFLRSMWEAVGGFDPRLSGPTDENEFFMRAFDAGFRPHVVPGAVVAYRLRPGARAWRRMRYRSGRGQGVAAGCAGGAHLRPLCTPPRSIVLLLKLVAVAPKYAWSRSSRHEWVGGVLRQWGRVVGWFSPEGRAIRAAAPPASATGASRSGPAR